jgi:hypothetical protein
MPLFDCAKSGMPLWHKLSISCCEVFKLFGIIYGHSTSSPVIFSTAGGIFQRVSREKLPYLDVTW